MRRFGLALGGFCAAGAVLSSTAAQAQEAGLRLVFGLENRLEVSRNSELSVPATGNEFTHETRLSFVLSSVREIDWLELSVSVAAIVEDGPGDDGAQLDFGRGEGELAYHREVSASVLDVGGYYRNDDIDSFDSLADADVTGTRTDFGANLSVETGRTSSVGLAFSAAYDETDFQDSTDPDLFDTTETRADAAVILHASETVTGRLGLRYVLHEEDDPESSRTETTTTYAGLDYAISERLDLEAEIGYAEVEDEEFGVTDRTSGPVLSFGLTQDMQVGTALALVSITRDEDEGQRETFELGRDLETPSATISARLGVTRADEAGTDLIGLLAIDRRLPAGSLGFRLERFVSYDDEPELNTVAALTWTRTVNDISSISLEIDYGLVESPSERIEQVSIGAGYRRDLTADWGLDTGISYRVRNDGDGHAESPTVFVSISREFEIRP